MPSEKVRHFRLGSVPASRIRSRSAPCGLGGEQHVAGPLDLAGLTLGEPDRRPVGLEVEELLGIDLGDQLRVERLGRGRERRGGRTRRVVPAGEGTDQNRGSKLRGLRLPTRARPWIEPSGLPGHAPVHAGTRGSDPGVAASRRMPQHRARMPERATRPTRARRSRNCARAALPRRLRLRAQGPPDRAQRLAVPDAWSCATAAGTIPARAFREVDRLVGSLRARATRSASRARSSASAASWSLSSTTSARWRAPSSTPSGSCRRPTATARSWQASWST